jgi:glycopeptide antibiotics resistance protein
VDLVPLHQVEVPALPILLPLGFALMALSVVLLMRRGLLSGPRLLTAFAAGWYAVAVLGATFLPLQLSWGADRYTQYHSIRIVLLPILGMRPLDFVLNTMMTVPFAALLYLVAGIRRKRRVVLIAFLISLAIETTQAVLDVTLHVDRWADVNDLMSNTLGAWLGYLWFWRAMGENWFRRPLARFAIRRPRPTADAVP